MSFSSRRFILFGGAAAAVLLLAFGLNARPSQPTSSSPNIYALELPVFVEVAAAEGQPNTPASFLDDEAGISAW